MFLETKIHEIVCFVSHMPCIRRILQRVGGGGINDGRSFGLSFNTSFVVFRVLFVFILTVFLDVFHVNVLVGVLGFFLVGVGRRGQAAVPCALAKVCKAVGEQERLRLQHGQSAFEKRRMWGERRPLFDDRSVVNRSSLLRPGRPGRCCRRRGCGYWVGQVRIWIVFGWKGLLSTSAVSDELSFLGIPPFHSPVLEPDFDLKDDDKIN